jgi:hypothetical protein
MCDIESTVFGVCKYIYGYALRAMNFGIALQKALSYGEELFMLTSLRIWNLLNFRSSGPLGLKGG